jgi:exodeoxyribonuclease-5
MVLPVDYPESLAVKISTPAEYFQGTESSLDWRVKKNCDEFCYGYAISVHKSQGSQWQNLLVLDQSKVFKQDAAKHLYTAITRASEKVTVLI